MKKYFILLVIAICSLTLTAQDIIECKNVFVPPAMNTSSQSEWFNNGNLIWADSAYVEYPSTPNYYDLGVAPNVDLELKFKTLWYDSTIFFLFRRLDDELVNGYNIDGTPDNTIADSLVNMDATAIYFYLRNDTIITDTTKYDINKVAWLRFVWQSDTMEAQLPEGEIVNTFEEAHTDIIQWKSNGYYYAKLAVDLGKIYPDLFDTVKNSVGIDTTFMLFTVELNENDKEIEEPYAQQTKAYWGSDVGENALDNVQNWSWLYFTFSSIEYISLTVNGVVENFAAIYPNPAVDQLTIKLEDYERVSYYMYDITGRVVIANKFEGFEESFEVSYLSPGTYILRLQKSDGGIMTKKILIVN